MRLYIFAAALALAAAGCSGSKTAVPFESKVITVEDVEMTPQPIIGRSLSMARSGDFLLLLDNKSDSLTHLFDIGNGRYAGEFVAKGQGPGEFGNLILISDLPGRDNTFAITRPDTHTLYEAKVVAGDSAYMTYTPLASLPDVWQGDIMDNGSYLTTNGYVDHPEIFTIYDRDGNITGRYGGRMPEAKASGAPAVEMTAAYQFSTVISPDGKKVAAVGGGDEAAAFFRFEADTLRAVSSFRNNSLNYLFADGLFHGVDGRNPGKVSFVDAVADNDFVYILYDGRDMNESDWTGNSLWVYDWEGNKLGEHSLTRRVKSISAPDSSGRIYAICQEDSDPGLVTFSLR